MKYYIWNNVYLRKTIRTRHIRRPIFFGLMVLTLAFTGCGSKETDAIHPESTVESSSLEESLEESAMEETSEDRIKESSSETKKGEKETGKEKETKKSEKDKKDGTDKEDGKKETASSGKESSREDRETSSSGGKESQAAKPSQTPQKENSGSQKDNETAAKPVQSTKAPVTLTGIQASYTGGTKTEGASVSAAEISVSAAYSDGSTKAVNGWTCSQAGQPLPAGSHTFTVSYEGKSSSFTVHVEPAPVQTEPPTSAPTQAPTEPAKPATSQAYIDEFMRGFNQARSDYGMTPNIGVNAKWSVYAQYYAEYHARKWPGDNWEAEAEHSGLELDWFCTEGIGYAYSAYDAGYDQAIHVGAYQYEDFGDIGVGVYYQNGRYYVCVEQWKAVEQGVGSFPNI